MRRCTAPVLFYIVWIFQEFLDQRPTSSARVIRHLVRAQESPRGFASRHIDDEAATSLAVIVGPAHDAAFGFDANFGFFRLKKRNQQNYRMYVKNFHDENSRPEARTSKTSFQPPSTGK